MKGMENFSFKDLFNNYRIKKDQFFKKDGKMKMLKMKGQYFLTNILLPTGWTLDKSFLTSGS